MGTLTSSRLVLGVIACAVLLVAGCIAPVSQIAQPQIAPSMYIDFNNPDELLILKSRLLDLAVGEAFEGVKQRDGNNDPFMEGWVFRRQVSGTAPGQRILILFNGYAEKAVAWVEPNGVDIVVPSAPTQADASPALELAIDLTGEPYEKRTVSADGKIIVFRYMPSEW